jgi:Tol biopolymer transport system component
VRRSLAIAPLGVALALVLLMGTVTLGLRLRSAGRTDALPDAAPLDYAGASLGAFSPLSSSFITDVLGSVISLPGRTQVAEHGGRGVTATAIDPLERVEVVHALTNDDRSHARAIPSVPFTARTDTRRATREPGEASPCGAVRGGTVWYRYTATSDTGLIANTFGTKYATTLGVFAVDAAPANVGCDTDLQGDALVQFAAHRGSTYLFQISGPAGGGDLVFSLDPDGVTRIESLSSTGEPADASANGPSLSADGRFVAFESKATNLVSTDTNGELQIFMRDRVRRKMTLVSVSSTGKAGNGPSDDAFVSGGGRYVTFESAATNLVPGDTNAAPDVFVRDVVDGWTERVSVSSEGAQALQEPPTEWGDATAERVLYNPQGGGDITMSPTMTPDGRYVAFQSKAFNLVSGDHNHTLDVFVHDRVTRVTERVSVSSSGGERGQDTNYVRNDNEDNMTPSISGNGRFVMFRTSAANLTAGDDNLSHDVFVHDRVTHTTQRITDSSNPANLEDDDEPRYTMNEIRPRAALSFDGRYVAFTASPRPTYGPAEANVFAHDRRTGRTVLANLSSAGEKQEPNRSTRAPAISWDGRYVAFHSNASNLVQPDDNGIFDVFVRDLETGTTVRLSGIAADADPLCRSSGHLPCGSLLPSISRDGSIVAFEAGLGIQTNSQIYVNERPAASG